MAVCDVSVDPRLISNELGNNISCITKGCISDVTMSAQRCAPDRSAKAVSVRSEPTLAPEASAALRDQLAAELRAIGSADDVAKWAYRALNVKNTLTAADAA